GLRSRDRINLVQLCRVGIAVGQRRRIFQRRAHQRGAALSTLKEKLGLEAIGGRPRDRLPDLLFILVTERDPRRIGRDVLVVLVGWGAPLRASRERYAEQGKNEG